MKKEFNANSIRNGLDYFNRQCNKRHIKMDEESELLCGAADVLDTVIRHRIGFLDTSGRPVS